MHLTHLSLTNFRNFSRLDLDVPTGTILLVGQNAQGKTSLLEAIYMLATFTSFHAENDRQLINFHAAEADLAVARIVARFQKNGHAHEMELRIIQEKTGPNGPRVRKEALLDKQKFKLNEMMGAFNAVLFLPQMLDVVEGPPQHRRRYLDLALAQVIPGYSAVLTNYNKVITQRNALLKQIADYGGDPAQLAYWDQELTTLGARIIRARIQAIQEIAILAAQIHLDLTRQAEVLRLEYRPSYDPLPNPDGQLVLKINDPKNRAGFTEVAIQKGFTAALEATRPEEIARGVTLFGPHRDELRFLSNGTDLGTYGSRGQVRTTMLTLKLAEVAWMKQKTDHWPVLLLDEVLAELDEYRRLDLLGRMAGCEQVLATTTDLAMFATDFVTQARVWGVRAGHVTA